MKNKIKYIVTLFVFVVLTTGCVKYNANMDVNRDKSVNFSIIYAMDSSLMGDQEILSEENKDQLEEKGYKIEEYKDDRYTGYKISKKYKNIDSISSDNDVEYSISDIMINKNSDDKIFKVKKGFFKNTYTAKFKFDTGDSSLADDSTDVSSIMSSMDLEFTTNLPHGAKSNNATESKNGKKKLTWDLTKIQTIEYTFYLYNLPFYLIIGGIIVVVIAVVVIIAIKKKPKKNVDNLDNFISSNEINVDNTNNKPILEEINVDNSIIKVEENEQSVDNSITTTSDVENNVDNTIVNTEEMQNSVDNVVSSTEEVENTVDNSINEN